MKLVCVVEIDSEVDLDPLTVAAMMEFVLDYEWKNYYGRSKPTVIHTAVEDSILAKMIYDYRNSL